MRTSLKAALAGVAGAGLLLGGAGSLAFWNDDETVGRRDHRAGTLNWWPQLLTDGLTASLTNAAGFRLNVIVPGTMLTEVCDFDLSVAGDVHATFAVNDQSRDATLGASSTWTPAVDRAGRSGPVSASDSHELTTVELHVRTDNGKVLTATITVELPWTVTRSWMVTTKIDNSSNSDGRRRHATVSTEWRSLSDLTVTVTQTP